MKISFSIHCMAGKFRSWPSLSLMIYSYDVKLNIPLRSIVLRLSRGSPSRNMSSTELNVNCTHETVLRFTWVRINYLLNNTRKGCQQNSIEILYILIPQYLVRSLALDFNNFPTLLSCSTDGVYGITKSTSKMWSRLLVFCIFSIYHYVHFLNIYVFYVLPPYVNVNILPCHVLITQCKIPLRQLDASIQSSLIDRNLDCTWKKSLMYSTRGYLKNKICFWQTTVRQTTLVTKETDLID